MRTLPITACMLLLAVSAAAQSARAPEYEVKAAFLYNFAKFVEWPPDAFPGFAAPMRVCVLGHDPFGDTLGDIVRGKTVGGHPIARAYLQSASEARFCHVLFISAAERATLQQALERINDDWPVLTVGDSPDFLHFGGVIHFVLEKDRVRFEINLAAAERHHLKVSSKLLALARVIEVGGGAH